jgi:hypothetical protein
MINKKDLKIYMREILQTRTRFDYTTTKEDLLKRVIKNYGDIDLNDFEEIITEFIECGEMYEKFKHEYLWIF